MTPRALTWSKYLGEAKAAHTDFEKYILHGEHKNWQDYYAVYLDWRLSGYDKVQAANQTDTEFKTK